MMKFDLRRAVFVLVGVFLATAGGCHDSGTGPIENRTVGSGRLVSRSETLSPFRSVHLVGIGSVYIVQDTVQTFRLEADDNIIDLVTVGVDNGILTIGIQKGSYSSITVNVSVSMTAVETLQLSGAGNITMSGPVTADQLTASILGAGNITLRGSTATLTVSVLGTGDLSGFDMTSASCTALLAGTGSIEVTATRTLVATLTGVGSIVYGGDPPQVTQTLTGVGTIRKRS